MMMMMIIVVMIIMMMIMMMKITCMIIMILLFNLSIESTQQRLLFTKVWGRPESLIIIASTSYVKSATTILIIFTINVGEQPFPDPCDTSLDEGDVGENHTRATTALVPDLRILMIMKKIISAAGYLTDSLNRRDKAMIPPIPRIRQ